MAQIYTTAPPAPALGESQAPTAMSIQRDGPFADLPTPPDLIITQGADTEIMICLEAPPQFRPSIRCIGPDYITFNSKVCVVPGDTILLTGFQDCDSNLEGQRMACAVSDDGMKITFIPAFEGILTQRCFTSTEPPLTGCVSVSLEVVSPRMVVLQKDWTLSGVLSYEVSDGSVRQFGCSGKAGSRYFRTTVMGLVKVADHMSIQGAGVVDAIVTSVSRGIDADTGIPVDVIELNQPASTTGCYSAFAAKGLLLNFGILADGACQKAVIPASVTKLLSPAPGAQVCNAGCDSRAFLGYYALFASAVYLDCSGNPQIQTFEVGSGCAILRLTAASNVRLQSLN